MVYKNQISLKIIYWSECYFFNYLSTLLIHFLFKLSLKYYYNYITEVDSEVSYNECKLWDSEL